MFILAELRPATLLKIEIDARYFSNFFTTSTEQLFEHVVVAAFESLNTIFT